MTISTRAHKAKAIEDWGDVPMALELFLNSILITQKTLPMINSKLMTKCSWPNTRKWCNGEVVDRTQSHNSVALCNYPS